MSTKMTQNPHANYANWLLLDTSNHDDVGCVALGHGLRPLKLKKLVCRSLWHLEHACIASNYIEKKDEKCWKCVTASFSMFQRVPEKGAESFSEQPSWMLSAASCVPFCNISLISSYLPMPNLVKWASLQMSSAAVSSLLLLLLNFDQRFIKSWASRASLSLSAKPWASAASAIERMSSSKHQNTGDREGTNTTCKS